MVCHGTPPGRGNIMRTLARRESTTPPSIDSSLDNNLYVLQFYKRMDTFTDLQYCNFICIAPSFLNMPPMPILWVRNKLSECMSIYTIFF